MAKLKLELSKDVLKKNVGVVHTTGTLSLLERKISNVLLLNAYDNLLKNRTHSLRVGYLTALLGWTESNNIADLKDALKKIKTSTYGICDMCGVNIPIGRLKAKPFAKFCTECRTVYEQEQQKRVAY